MRPGGPDEQTLLGQFYTPPAVADLLVALTLEGSEGEAGPPTILDPACGDGALLASAYEWLAARGYLHAQLLESLWGFELSQAAATAATAALAARGEGSPYILAGDFFAREPGQFAGAREVPGFDRIIGNPPYLRSQNQDDLDPAYRARLFQAAARAGVRPHAKTDLFGFFIYHASRFLKIGGRLGFITPASWLTSEYAAALQTLLVGELRLSVIVSSSAESFFPEVDVHTVLLLAERVDPAAGERGAALRFVTLRRPLAELTAGGERHDRVRALAREIREGTAPREDEVLRVHVVPVAGERAALAAAPGVARNWSRHLRAPLSFERLFGGPAFTSLGQVGRVALGYKSLQNEFYYVDRATIDAYSIEARFLEPIVMLGDLDGLAYLQGPAEGRWIFLCRESEDALRDTGALRYINAMAGRTVAQRKQSGAGRTIREVLAAQGGGLWYGPKARPHPAHIWLRKAIDTVYAPLLFKAARVVDQRCNYVEPLDGLAWEPLAAVLTATTFAYALEVCGAASMGAGALEAATTRLRTYPVFDPRMLNTAEQAELVGLARVVWTQERPLDLGRADGRPGPGLLALDRWVLARAGGRLAAEQLYEDLHGSCDTRIRVARARRSAQAR